MSTTDDLTQDSDIETGADTAPTADHAQPCSLREEVERSLDYYFDQLGDHPVSELYQMVLAEVEVPLLEAVLRHTRSNQSKASIMLGLNRGTLRKKLKQYGML